MLSSRPSCPFVVKSSHHEEHEAHEVWIIRRTNTAKFPRYSFPLAAFAPSREPSFLRFRNPQFNRKFQTSLARIVPAEADGKMTAPPRCPNL
jgi:hypothetical protein